MAIPGVENLSRTLERQFMSAVDVGDKDTVHALLQQPDLRAAIPGDLGNQAVYNLDTWVPRLQKNLEMELKYSSSASDAAYDQALLGSFKAIAADLKAAGAKLTAGLTRFLGG